MSEQTMSRPSMARAWLRALRLHQWAKNALVFAPLALAGVQSTLADIERALAGFLALGLASSAGYIVNDLIDTEADRGHPIKRNRPFAAQLLPAWVGIVTVPVLLVLAAAIALALPPLFGKALAVYIAGTLLYSVVLKRMAPYDLVVIGGLFTVRVLAGMAFVKAPISLWFLTFAMFMFIGLAAVKRYAELLRARTDAGGPGSATVSIERGYDTSNLGFILALGVGCGIAAVMIFVMYLILDRFPAQIYGNPEALWFMAPVILAWLMRVWLLASRGEMNEDPIAFALSDVQSWVLGLVCAVLIFLAW